MAHHRKLVLLATLPLLASMLVACQGASPTEPSALDLAESKSLVGDSGAASSVGTADDNGGAVADKRRNRGRGNGGSGDDNSGRGRGRGRGGRGNGNNGGGNGNGNPTQPGNPPRTGFEVEGSVTAVSGNAIIVGGRRVIVNGNNVFDPRGDLFSLAQVQGALAGTRPVRAEARGTLQADGSLIANIIKVEVD